jgi:hypothetical protein
MVKCNEISTKNAFTFLSQAIGTNDLHASDGRDTEALDCKPVTNL